MGPIGCPETSVTSYQPTPRNIPEERRPELHRCGSLKSRIIFVTFRILVLAFRSNMLPLAEAFREDRLNMRPDRLSRNVGSQLRAYTA
jgi:hypothetical protein